MIGARNALYTTLPAFSGTLANLTSANGHLPKSGHDIGNNRIGTNTGFSPAVGGQKRVEWKSHSPASGELNRAFKCDQLPLTSQKLHRSFRLGFCKIVCFKNTKPPALPTHGKSGGVGAKRSRVIWFFKCPAVRFSPTLGFCGFQ